MPCKKEENKVKSACAVYLNVNEQADYRSITQLSLLKIKFRRLGQEYDRNTHTRSTSYQDGYQPDAVVGYG